MTGFRRTDPKDVRLADRSGSFRLVVQKAFTMCSPIQTQCDRTDHRVMPTIRYDKQP